MFEPTTPTHPTAQTYTRPRVLIADGDRRVLRSLAGVLEASGQVDVVGCASTAVETIDMALGHCPDAILLHLDRLEAEAWLDLISTFRCACTDSRIVVLSAETTFRDAAMRAGADAFLNEFESTDEVSELVNAISTAGSSERFE
jgi:DNA-binding NarL/FixJ family response regulator